MIECSASFIQERWTYSTNNEVQKCFWGVGPTAVALIGKGWKNLLMFNATQEKKKCNLQHPSLIEQLKPQHLSRRTGILEQPRPHLRQYNNIHLYQVYITQIISGAEKKLCTLCSVFRSILGLHLEICLMPWSSSLKWGFDVNSMGPSDQSRDPPKKV